MSKTPQKPKPPKPTALTAPPADTDDVLRLIDALFERTIQAPPRLSTPLAELHPEAETVFKEATGSGALPLRVRSPRD